MKKRLVTDKNSLIYIHLLTEISVSDKDDYKHYYHANGESFEHGLFSLYQK